MPNWVEGTLRVRGTADNVRKFLLNALEPISGERLKEKDGWIESKITCHISETERGFIDNFCEIVDDIECTGNVIMLEARFAWNVKAEWFEDLSKQYSVDFRFYGFERGAEFNRNIEVINGEITRDEIIKFDNYFWDCISPERGG